MMTSSWPETIVCGYAETLFKNAHKTQFHPGSNGGDFGCDHLRRCSGWKTLTVIDQDKAVDRTDTFVA
jgi:hypothetical protein